MSLEWFRYGNNGVVWFGKINGEKFFQITLMSDGTYSGKIDSLGSHYSILEKATELGEAQRFCNWVARAYGWL